MADAPVATEQIEHWIARLRQGDRSAREALLACAGDRLLRLTRKMLKQSADVKRWEQTDDVFQNAMMRLYRALDQVELQSARHFYHIAAMQIRRELIDLARRYQGPRGMGRYLQSQVPLRPDEPGAPPRYEVAEQTHDPTQLASWLEFHLGVERLPEEDRETFQLLWYAGLTLREVAEALNVSVRTVRRRWQSARLQLHDVLSHNELDG
jgi:RNA polymerase sigma-70 factor (ECF subfamily)